MEQGARSKVRRVFIGIMLMTVWLVSAHAADKPNVVVILADDMGIDSVAALNDKCSIPTPNLDALVNQGTSFTDAHSGSAVCTPTRYGLLTGRYAWRSRLKRGIVRQWERPLIETQRLTVASMLKAAGYDTACIGKWHLGWNWPKKGGGFTEKLSEIDFTKSVQGGPAGCGFDYYYGDDVPNWQPFVWIENGKMIGVPDTKLTFPKEYHAGSGIGVKGWDLEAVLPKITEKSVEYVTTCAAKKQPFFLYFSLTAPHTPIAPSKAFQGKSGISRYADFLMETDWCVGQIMKALDDAGVADNTLLIVTADNGTSPKCNFAQLREKKVDLQNHWRGMKADGFEGGHRVPFIVRWPGKVKSGRTCAQTISLVDIMATCADAAGVKLPDTAGEDSVSLMPALNDPSLVKPLHEAVICHSSAGVFVVRQGKWKLQFSAGSGGWSEPKDRAALKKGLPKWQLYELSTDPKETRNVVNEHPKVVESLTATLRKFVEDGRSTPGAPQKNHGGTIWWKGLPWSH